MVTDVVCVGVAGVLGIAGVAGVVGVLDDEEPQPMAAANVSAASGIRMPK